MIRLTITNLNKVKRSLDYNNKELVKKIDAEMQSAVFDINAEQQRRVPVDMGFLKSSLGTDRIEALRYVVFSAGSGSEYAPYQEFGTGGLVKIPKGLESEAAKFKAWSISAQKNMKAQPFFYAPAFERWAKLKKRIENMLKK
jgi:Bacteriophage HK97-gp10, putative tail-component